MLNSNDILLMENSVRDTVKMWNMTVSVLKPLPLDDQPNWNSNFHEYSGDIYYTKYINVSVERRDQTNMHMYDIDTSTGAGDSGAGRLIFSVSNINTFIDKNCRILYDNSQWRIVTIRERIGENVIIIEEMVGSNESWALQPSSIVDCGGV